MIDERTGKDLKDLEVLGEHQIYIYAMLNSCGKIKIGITKNIQRRYQSLCGSNGQGNDILRVYCSPATYLQSMEKVLHTYFARFRIKNTEWFVSNKNERLNYSDVIRKIEELFSSSDYERCNELKRKMYG